MRRPGDDADAAAAGGERVGTGMLGVVADDLTGATDIAGAIASHGLATSILVGVPDSGTPRPQGSDCVVIALKTRTAPRERAVSESMAAASWLIEHGADTVYQKYCSTFDSTPDGMIGPVADALVELMADAGGPAMTIGTPASPALGRTVYQGHLFVNGVLLSDSPMRDHPLTPMRDSRLVPLLTAQSTGEVALLTWDELRASTAEVARRLRGLADAGVRHVMADAIDDGDLDTIAAAAELASVRILGGGAGLGAALAKRRAARLPDEDRPAASGAEPGRTTGERLIIAGSCSARTREQVAAFGGTTLRLDPLALRDDAPGTILSITAQVAAAFKDRPGAPVLVHSCADPQDLALAQRTFGTQRAAAAVEEALARLAESAVRSLGVTRLIVAGGETSGAVIGAIGVRQLTIAAQVDPGVPWTISPGDPALSLLLKSGNLGRVSLFTDGWELCP